MAGVRCGRHSVIRSSNILAGSPLNMNSISIVLLAITAVLAVEDGDYHPCNVGAPDFQQCVRSTLQHLIPQLANGLPHISAAPIEPLRGLPSLRHSSPSGLNVQLDNVEINGLSTVVVKDVHADLTTNTIRMVSTVPSQLVATGVHTTDATIMGVPLKGSGPFTITLAQPTLDLTLAGAPTVGPDGQTYLRLTSGAATLHVGSVSIDVGESFSQYSPLAEAGNAFVNSVAGPVIQDMTPSLEKWLAGIVLERAQAVFSTVPYDAIFPGRSPAVAGLYRAFPTAAPALHF